MYLATGWSAPPFVLASHIVRSDNRCAVTATLDAYRKQLVVAIMHGRGVCISLYFPFIVACLGLSHWEDRLLHAVSPHLGCFPSLVTGEEHHWMSWEVGLAFS